MALHMIYLSTSGSAPRQFYNLSLYVFVASDAKTTIFLLYFLCFLLLLLFLFFFQIYLFIKIKLLFADIDANYLIY